MKKLESTFANMFIVLTVISIVAGAGLAAVFKMTEAPIAEANLKKQQEAIAAVLPEGAQVGEAEQVNGNNIYRATDAQGAFAGMAIEINTNGFGGNVKMMVGFDAKGALVDYSILEMSETPGLGSKMGEWFREKSDIRGALVSDGEVKVSKDGGKYDAITAATISSRAFMTGVNAAMATFTAATAEEIPTDWQDAEAFADSTATETENFETTKTEEAAQ
ncbi:MAG: RnfABCDGE type electron transport complex subunit G [Paludibacteraceae bacterium]|nr:RnfABCDGE type electron transport complex subunit G [Paludibacteraceae bacterium]